MGCKWQKEPLEILHTWERKNNSIRNVYRPLKQYPRDVEGTIDQMRVTILKFSSLLSFLFFVIPFTP